MGQYADLLNRDGPDSKQEKAFVKQHEENQDFVRLAKNAKFLKQQILKRQRRKFKKAAR